MEVLKKQLDFEFMRGMRKEEKMIDENEFLHSTEHISAGTCIIPEVYDLIKSLFN